MSFRGEEIEQIARDMTIGTGTMRRLLMNLNPNDRDITFAEEIFGASFTPEQREHFTWAWKRYMKTWKERT
jgi:hypothetical protein